MSSNTNRAFIKAYRQDSGERSPNARATSAAARSPIASMAPPSAVGTTTSTRARSPRRPLSSYINRERAAAAPANSGEIEFLQPGTTVASFQWPKVCRTLALQSGAQLDHVVELVRSQAEAGHSLVGVMGLFPRVGTTTTALCLALRAARRVNRAIVVDANFCHPRMATWLDATPTVGWEEVLRHTAHLADAVVRATDDHLDLLALGAKASRDPLPLATGLQAGVTAGILRHAYDLTLIDLGTFFDSSVQPIVLALVRNMGIDSVIAVAANGPADPRDLATIAEHFEPIGCQLLGTIENRLARGRA